SAKGIEYAMEYDSRLDLVRLVEAGERVTQWEISAARKPVARQDAQGLTTFRYIGDALVEQVDPDGGHWRFGYDALCRLRWLVNPAGERYERAYDGAGYLARETSFAGLTTEYERDGSGFVVATRRSDGSWIRYERDGEGRPLQVEYSSGLVERFSYDHMGALVSAENGVTQVTFLRDELGRIVQEEMHAGEFEFAVTRTFDGIGGVARRDYASGWSVEAFRDRADGRLSTIRAQVGERFCEVGIERDALGQEVARHYESDGASAYASVGFERNRHGLPTAIVIRRGDEVLRERRYDWSPVGPVAEVSDSINGHRTYDLDSKGRVLGFRGLGGRETSTVTPHGLSVPSDGEWQLSTGGRPVVTDRARLSWDDRSRLTRREGSEARSSWSFVYDEADRLVEAKCDDGLRVRYLYDALGRQVARLREDGDSTWFGWDGDRLVEERRSTGEVIRRVHDDDGFTPLLEARGDGAFDAVVTDAAGTPWLFMKHDGAFGELELGPWGDVLRDDGCATTLRFAGQRADDDTGLHYNRHRWYDPSIRVFTTPDPLGVFVSPHEIGFVPNVTLYVDPDGLTIIVTAASDEGVQQSSGNLQRWFPGATVIPHDQLQPGSLAGEDHVILLTHGAPGKLQWGDGITNGQTVGETLKGAGLSRTAAVDLYACNGATPPRGGGPSAAQQIANATGNTVRGARSNNPEATYSGTSTPITDQRFADAGQAPPGVLAINGGTGAGVHDGEFVTVQPERGPVGRAWDTVTGRRRSGSDLPPGLPDGPAP
ncbi:MAG TPA: hypothetical protein ENK57_20925, partial [Polyangiaceae bacterium]|nr:hypothetical protein [Polyangiaceae bacterium]